MSAPIEGRRGFLRGLASLPMAPAVTTAAAAVSMASFDPFPAYHRELGELFDAMKSAEDDDAMDLLADRWSEIDDLALTSRPTTLAGAIACLEWTRREHVQFNMKEGRLTDDRGANLVLSLLDGALGVLRAIRERDGLDSPRHQSGRSA